MQGSPPEAGADRALLGRALDFASDAILIVEVQADHPVVYANSAFEKLSGSRAADLLGRPWHLLREEDPASRAEPELARALTERATRVVTTRDRRADGTSFWNEVSLSPLPGSDGCVTHLIAVQRDVTDQREAEEAARQEALERRRSEQRLVTTEDRYRSLVEQVPAIVYRQETGLLGRCVYVSPQVEAILGYTPEDWQVEQSLWEARLHPEDRERVIAAKTLSAATGNPFVSEHRVLHRDGRAVWIRDESVVVSPENGGPPLFDGILYDISERKDLEHRLHHDADHDPVTKLFNRHRFERELEMRVAHARRYQRSFAVVLLDLDNFKFVNDSFGHARGDALIERVARAIETRLRETDLLARVGGDEFAVLLPESDEAGAAKTARALLDVIRGKEERLAVTGSAGVAVFDPESTATASDLLASCDIALYEAKDAGRDQTVTFTGRRCGSWVWVERIRAALRDDRLILHSQPIVELPSGRKIREELLVRMLDEEGQVIPPGAFLPVAEHFGLVQEIDRWVVGKAIRLAAAGRHVGVNLSARSFGDPSLTDLIEREVAELVVEPDRLTFEITETAVMANLEEAEGFAKRLRNLGCRLALDDFGTGFGSFTYLKHFPVDELKIDIEFVRGLPVGQTDRRVIEAIVSIARGFGQQTVAEGVEHADALTALSECGVDFAQGYHMGRPELLLSPGHDGEGSPSDQMKAGVAAD